MRVKIKHLQIISSIISVILLLLLIILIPLATKTNDDTPTEHNYKDAVITDKYIVDGFGGIYVYQPTEFVIVAEIHYENETVSYTNYVSEVIYNSYQIGDTLQICISHNKIIEYE